MLQLRPQRRVGRCSSAMVPVSSLKQAGRLCSGGFEAFCASVARHLRSLRIALPKSAGPPSLCCTPATGPAHGSFWPISRCSAASASPLAAYSYVCQGSCPCLHTTFAILEPFSASYLLASFARQLPWLSVIRDSTEPPCPSAPSQLLCTPRCSTFHTDCAPRYCCLCEHLLQALSGMPELGLSAKLVMLSPP